VTELLTITVQLEIGILVVTALVGVGILIGWYYAYDHIYCDPTRKINKERKKRNQS